MKLRPSLLRSWLETVGTSAGIVGFSFLTGVLSARLLGPGDRGLLAAAMFWPGLIASLGFLSLGEAAVYRRNHTQLGRSRFVATVISTSLCLAFLATLCAVPLLPWLLGSQRANQLPMLVVYAAAFLPCYFLAMGLLSIDTSERNFRKYNILRFSNPLVYLLGIVVLWMSAGTCVQNFLWAAFFGTAANAALCVWAARRCLLALPSFDEASRLVHQGIVFHGATVVMVVTGQADRIVVMAAFGNADIGRYVVALTLASAATSLVTNSVQTVLFPSIAATADRADRIDQFRNGIRRTWLFVVGSSLMAAIVLPFLLPLIFGEAFREARSLVAILALAMAPMTVRQVALACVRAFGDGRTGVFVEVGAVLVFGVLVLPALLINDLWAVGVAFGLANAVALLLTARLIHTRYGVPSAAWLLPSARMIDDVRLISSYLFRLRPA